MAAIPQSGATPLRARFDRVMASIADAARPGEVSAGWLRAERSDFVRFNHGRVRQCGTVERHTLELRLIGAGRQARHCVTLTGDAVRDLDRVQAGFAWLRERVAAAQPDPYLSISEQATRGQRMRRAQLPDVEEITDTVSQAAAGADLVGFYAGGPAACAFASSLGHAHWHEADSWSFDYSVYAGGAPSAAADGAQVGPPKDKAVKATAAGTDWSASRVAGAIAASVRESALLRRPARRLAPGRYRAWLSPRAVADLIEMLGWGGFSARSHMSGHSPLARLRSGEAAFDPRVQLAEDLAGAGVPQFQSDGFVRPARLDLVREGRFADLLVSPRSAREFALRANGAADAESPEALSMAAGDLDERESLGRLGTGLAISNFWYLNFSDRQSCRVTGMTRFATMWVQDGEPVAPVEVMRFDDSLYRVLGEALEALGARAHRIPNTDSYDARAFGSTSAPGALVRQLEFTL